MAKLGTVQFISGIVKAIATDGTERILHAGDKVQANEKISTGELSSIVIVFDDGTRLDLGRDSQMLLTEDAINSEPEITQIPVNAQQAAQTEVDALQKALQDENFDPTKSLPATAAGGAPGAGSAGGGNQGHTFVSVDYLNPQLTPNSGFETIGPAVVFPETQIEILILNPAIAAPIIPVPVTPTIDSINLTDDTVPEGTSLVYTVTLNGSSAVPLNYSFSLGGGTASPSDYGSPVFSNGVTLNPDGTVTVPAGVSAFTVTVPTIDDTLHEDTETVPLTIGGVTGIGGILDNDAAPSISRVEPGAIGPGDDNVTEGTSLVYTVTLNGSSAVPLNYTFSLGGGTASPSDYGSPVFSNGVTLNPDGTVTVPAGVSAFTVTVPTIDDTLHEDTETVPLTIGGVTGIGGILDNDAAPSISRVEPGAIGPGDDNVTEGTSLVYTVTLNGSSAVPLNYTFSLGGGTASPSDYGSPVFSNGVTLNADGTVTVPAGVSAFTVTVPTIDDTLHEDTETVPLTIGGVTGMGGILDNDAAPSISRVEPGAIGPGDDNVTEGTSLVYTVTLNGSSAVPLNYTFSLGGGTASPSDYGSPVFSNGVTLNPDGTVTVPAGVSAFTVTVPTIDDTLHEDTETVPLTIGGVTGMGGILDNDAAPSISRVEPGAIGPGDDNVTEGTSLVYTVTLNGSSAVPLNYTFSLGGGTASPSDYGSPVFSNGVTLNPDGTVTVPAGVSAFTVTVPTIDDTLHEDTETVPLTIGGVTGMGGILDNDAAPSISRVEPGAIGPGDDNVTEGTSLVYTVTLNGSSAVPLNYTFSLGGGTASPSDYGSPVFSNGVTLNPDGTVTVPAGVSAFTVTVPTIDDTLHEDTETVPLTIGGVTGMGGILDNDAAPSISRVEPGAIGPGDDNVTEGTSLVYTVTLNGSSAVPLNYTFSLGGGTASPSDYGSPVFSNGVTLNPDGTVTVPAGVTAFTVTVPTLDDTLHEDTETVPLTIGGVTGMGGILDNDAAPSISRVEPGAIGPGDDNVTEGTSLVYTVTLNGSSAVPLNYTFSLGGGTASPSDYGSPVFSNGVTLNPDGTVTVPAGVTAFTVTVPTLDDTLHEDTETVPLTIGGVTGIGGILDNDAAPSISRVEPGAIGPGDDNVTEGTSLVYTVTLNGSSAVPLNYTFSLGGGTASPSDYGSPVFSNGVTLNPDGTVTVPAGVTAFTVTVPTIDDTLHEDTETVPLTIGGVTGMGGILDNDPVKNTPPLLDLDANNSHNILSVQQISGLFNTGVDSNGTKLSLGVADPHYSLVALPASAPTTNQTVALSSSWIADNASNTSTWIGSTASNPTGLYQYQTSFDLAANANPASIQIEFDMAFDNSLRDILVNGVSTGMAFNGQGNGIGFTKYTHVQLSGENGLFSNSHTNTITFVVDNRDNVNQAVAGPTGLRIDNLHATVMVVGSDISAHQPDYATIFVEGTPVSIADTDALIQDDGSIIQSATITLTNQQAGDVLFIASALPSGISSSLIGNVLTLSGTASLADYQQAIKSVQFNNSSENPNSSIDRIITVKVNDGQADSNLATTTIHVVGVADKPLLDLNGPAVGSGYNAIYNAKGAGVAITGASTSISDIDSILLSSATIHISNALAGDVLVASNLPSGIQPNIYDPVTGTLTLSGSASLADYQTALQHVTFQNTSNNPDHTSRIIELTVNDGKVNSDVAISKIDVVSNIVNGTDFDDKISASNSGDAISGKSGNDLIFGGNGNDILSGDSGNDVIFGGAGNDQLLGGSGNDVLYGGAGNDLLTGGSGTDSFVWNKGETGVDIITDFTVGKGGDSLNLADLLQGEHSSDSGSLSSFLTFNYDSKSQATTITIDADQFGHGNSQTQAIVLQNVDLTSSGTLSTVDIINNLLANGNIETDQ